MMHLNRSRSLALRFAMPIVLVVGVAAVIGSHAIERRENLELEQAYSDRLQTIAATIQLMNDVAGGPQLQRGVSVLSAQSDVLLIVVISPDGRVMVSSQRNLVGVAMAELPAEISTRIGPADRIVHRDADSIDGTFPISLVADGDVRVRAGTLFISLDGSSLSGRTAELRSLVVRWLVGLLLLVVVVVLGVFRWTVLGALHRIIRTIHGRSAGEQQLRTGLRRTDIIGSLARTLDASFDAIDEREGELVRSRAESVLGRARLEAALDGSLDAVFSFDEHGLIIDWNPQAAVMFNASEFFVLGRRVEDVIGYSASSVGPTMDAVGESRITSILTRLASERERHELVLRRTDGTTFPAELSVVLVDLEGAPVSTVFIRDITERRQFEEQLAHQAGHDLLTGLPNRRGLTQHIEVALARARRRNAYVSLLLIDLDRFKNVNDSLGHDAGDRLLGEVARRLREIVRGGDVVARLGGDEFVVLADQAEGLDGAEELGRRIIALIEEPFMLGSAEIRVSASIGLVHSDGVGDPEHLVRAADAALYAAKDAGRGCVAVYDEALREAASQRVTTETALRQALGSGELFVEYQPIVRLDDVEMVGVEALVRWNRPGMGIVPPSEFIALAEETGLILPIGSFVLRTACEQVARWRRDDPDCDLYVTVNVSWRQMQQSSIVAEIDEVLTLTGIPPSCLCLEITESGIMEGPHLLDRLAAIKELGVRLAVDDFGTGYSSLTYLRQFPVDIVKIDRSFVAPLDDPAADTTIVAAVVFIAGSLGLSVVAEGVEAPFHADALRSLGCQLGQGWLYGRSAPGDSVRQDFARRRAEGFSFTTVLH